MRFYDREAELAELARIRELAFADHSRMTVITGRRRIGKTSLISKALEMPTSQRQPSLYLFVSRKSEAALCREFAEQASAALGMLVPAGVASFGQLFRILMEASTHTPFTLVIDEFQEFESINRTVFSDIQNHWDQLRRQSQMNLIISGSVYTLMHKIFRDQKQPLFGRADVILDLKPFSVSTLKEIIQEGNEAYSHDDLLALFSFTGGVPKYVELLFDNGALSVESSIGFIARENSLFIDEGTNLLVGEFGRNYGIYFSILQAISEGATTQSRIADLVGESSLSGYLRRLEEDYSLLSRKRPILAKPTSQTVRYEIDDNFLNFWFAFFQKNRAMVEIGNIGALRSIIESTYPTYSGLMLERYFIKQLAETGEFKEIGSWWEPRGTQNEIDIVALYVDKNRALVAEVKRRQESFRISQLEQKAEQLKAKAMNKYRLELRCLTLEDM